MFVCTGRMTVLNYWEASKKHLLADPRFMTRLLKFDRDAMSDETVVALQVSGVDLTRDFIYRFVHCSRTSTHRTLSLRRLLKLLQRQKFVICIVSFARC
jgi:hypothetical protein